MASHTTWRPWTASEDQRLRQLYSPHARLSQIASRMPGRSQRAVEHRLLGMGLGLSKSAAPKPPKQERPIPARRLTPDEKFQAALAGRAFDALVMKRPQP